MLADDAHTNIHRQLRTNDTSSWLSDETDRQKTSTSRSASDESKFTASQPK